MRLDNGEIAIIMAFVIQEKNNGKEIGSAG